VVGPPVAGASGGADRLTAVLVLLPPSETKAPGGTAPTLDLDDLLWPDLRETRSRVLSGLASLSADLPTARAALRVAATKDDEILRNALLRSAPTMPALDRYTGVLYEALDVPSMSSAQRSRARGRVLVASALFGTLRAADRIPAYRLSAGSVLPGLGPVTTLWRAAAGPMLAELDTPVLDLRSGAYTAFGHVPGAITVRVMSRRPDGSLAIVSHFNKATKGRLARIVAASRGEPSTLRDVIRLARRAGMRLEQVGPAALEIVTD
jgi:cytoplasmic iron level regulating protein YaaA (DUF328/UPF0246 family)